MLNLNGDDGAKLAKVGVSYQTIHPKSLFIKITLWADFITKYQFMICKRMSL